MIRLAVIAFLGATCFPIATGIGEDLILGFVEELRHRMCHPIPKLGLPALDPFHISNVEYEINNKYLINFTGSVTDFRLTGLSDFVVNDLKITTLPLRRSTLDLTMPFTAIKSLYTAKGSLANIINLGGGGNAEAHLENLHVTISWVLRTGIYLGIRNFKIAIKVGDIFIYFEKLIEEVRIDEFFHALVNEMGLELLNDVWKLENQYIEDLLEAKINNFLGQYSLGDIIKLIGSGGDEPIFGPDDPPADCKSNKI